MGYLFIPNRLENKKACISVVSEEKVHFSNVVTGVNGYLPCPMAGILRVYHRDSC